MEMERAIEMLKESISHNLPSLESDDRFHRAIVTAARNRVLSQVYNQIANLLLAFKQEMLLMEDKEKSLSYHERIYLAI